MLIKERIIQLIEFKKIPKEEFYTRIGMTSANFRGQAKKTPINSTAIENILSEIPDVNPQWLLTGKGSMLKSARDESIDPMDKELIRELIARVGELSQQLGEQTKENEHLYQKNIELQSKINELKESGIGDKSPRGYSFHSDNVKSVADPERKYKRKPNI